ncbi:calcium/calmodulin-dependent protein kinase type II alpha chain-like isoform X3 [Halichondria panicea]|uniref:calcium/calmodulin-dependent protein kinase type II alpha chain-like isoform X3 n=1 Tax=Halichondria panicea TaxID=6063 RepID=UPI00312BC1F6
MVTVRLEGDLVTPLCVCARNHTLGILVKPVITATTATQSTVDTQLVTGMEFHKFYFDHHLPASPSAIQQSMITPKVQMLGDSGAYCAYIRLIQTVDKEGVAHSVSIPETRIWQDIGSMFILIARLVGPIQRGHLTPLRRFHFI